MKRCLVSIVFLLVAHFTYAQSIPKVETGSIVRVENFSSKYITNRNIDIWLPQDYNVNKKYAVLYMQDGQMLFDSNTTWNKKSWMMQSSITKLIKENIIKERMLIYKEKSEPILNYYRDFCSVIDFEAKNGVDDFPNMRDLL